MEALTDTGGSPAPAGPGGGALVLVGFMGAGKSSSARSLAAELGELPLDSDRELETVLGEPIEAFFDREGEPAFRMREEEVVLDLLERARDGVVALGGGAAGSERVREALRVPHRRPPRGGARGGLAACHRQGPAARPRPRAASSSCTPTARGSTTRSPTPTCRRGRGTPPAGRCPRSWRCARRAPRAWTPSGWCGRARGSPSTRCSWAGD